MTLLRHRALEGVQAMAVTMKDVAERAGVSLPTVSRVINDTSYVKAQTRTRVLAAIAELQYSPNQLAISLRSQRTNTLALLVPDIANIFWKTVLRGVEDEASARGYHLFLGNTDDAPEKEARYVEGLLRRRIEGLLIVPTARSMPLLRRLRQQELPFVVVHRKLVGLEAQTVRSDAHASALILMQHLLAAGRRRIAFVGGELGRERLQAYREALAAAGVACDPALIRIGPLTQPSGAAMVAALLREGTPLDAMFIGNNRLAIGALHALTTAGKRIPEDVAIAAFYDEAALGDYAPPMIAAIQPVYEIGRVAARQLFARLGHTPSSPVGETILSNRIVTIP